MEKEAQEVVLETFFVYRTLRSGEWGCILGDAAISNLPNADFVTKVFARNEKEAISQAKTLYEAVHQHDSDKDNVRRFACAALKAIVAKELKDNEHTPEMAALYAMDYALEMNKEFVHRIAHKYLPAERLIKDAEQERQDGEDRRARLDTQIEKPVNKRLVS